MLASMGKPLLAAAGALEAIDQEGAHPVGLDDGRERSHAFRALDAVDRVELRGELALVLEHGVGERALVALARSGSAAPAHRLLELGNLGVGEGARDPKSTH